MSYEGTEEYLCANGHYCAIDCHADQPGFCGQKECNELMVWHHSIDETNGCSETDPGTFPAPLEETGWDDVPHTDHYGNSYFIRRVRYKPAEGSGWSKLPTPGEIVERD